MNSPESGARFSMRCPVCTDGELVERTNQSNGSTFLGCTGWPDRCTHTEPLPAYVILKRQGAAVLPGFEDL